MVAATTLMRDPEAFMSHLPQPFRRVDEILADIISNALRDAEQREREKDKESMWTDVDAIQGPRPYGAETSQEGMACKAIADAVGQALTLAEQRMKGRSNDEPATTTGNEEDGIENTTTTMETLETTKPSREGGRDHSEESGDMADETDECVKTHYQLGSISDTDAKESKSKKKKLTDIGALLTYLPPLPPDAGDGQLSRTRTHGEKTRGALMSWKELTASDENFMYTI